MITLLALSACYFPSPGAAFRKPPAETKWHISAQTPASWHAVFNLLAQGKCPHPPFYSLESRCPFVGLLALFDFSRP